MQCLHWCTNMLLTMFWNNLEDIIMFFFCYLSSLHYYWYLMVWIKAKCLSVKKYQWSFSKSFLLFIKAAVLTRKLTPVKMAYSVWSWASWLTLAGARTRPCCLCYDTCSSVLSHARNLEVDLCISFRRDVYPSWQACMKREQVQHFCLWITITGLTW